MNNSRSPNSNDNPKRPFVSKFTKGFKWMPKAISYEETSEDLTAGGGHGNIVDLFCECPHFEAFRDCLPQRKSNFSYDTAQFGITVLSGFWFDHECLEDVEELEDDSVVSAKLDGVPSARSVGEWLRDFEDSNIESLNEFLTRQALSLRMKISPEAPIVIDMDSTSHVQTGVKMEGLAYNYKDQWCLDSLLAFDDLGFSYAMDLRPGNTFSSTGAGAMIRKIFSKIKSHKEAMKLDRYFRADSAFCSEEVIRSCLLEDTKFSITAHGNIGWEEDAKNLSQEVWSEWTYSDEEILESQKKKRVLPRVEVASFLYEPGWSENLRFTVVVKREWKDFAQGSLFEGTGHWDYYAVLTNISMYKFTLQSLLEHHKSRGQSENFIREAKYGYDLKHFPCQRLRANHAYGLLGLVAHNFLRAMSLLDDPSKPKYSKRLRRKLVFIPGKLVRHARQFVLRIPTRFLKEVKRIRQRWEAPPKIPPQIRLRAWSTMRVQVL